MSTNEIVIEGLGKRYKIRHAQSNSHPTFKDFLTSGATALRQRVAAIGGGGGVRKGIEEFWALRDVSLTIGAGERFGIIGRNGAGKSTLLKILSRITEPTTGSVRIHGRVSSLLEVGTGFHPELTGRENVFLNGAILGMTKAEIARKFDEIVEFAGVEKFLDTPVKRFSSGMYVRLAFAIAAHLEPEILIVDEVLAVGDAEFQKKCIGKMQDVSTSEGRTVLFVSHNMDAIQRLCSRCVLLEMGRVAGEGETAEIVARYISAIPAKIPPNAWLNLENASRVGRGGARFTAMRFSSGDEHRSNQPYSNGPVEFELLIDSDADRTIRRLAVTFYSGAGLKLVNADTRAIGETVNLLQGRNTVRLRIDRLHLNAGTYFVGLSISEAGSSSPLDFIDRAVSVEVLVEDASGYDTRSESDGVVTCPFRIVR